MNERRLKFSVWRGPKDNCNPGAIDVADFYDLGYGDWDEGHDDEVD